MKNGDDILVTGTLYGNDIGKAIVLDRDYKGFPGKIGMLVQFIDSPDHVGFVYPKDCRFLRSLDPSRKSATPVEPTPLVCKTMELINERLQAKKKGISQGAPQRLPSLGNLGLSRNDVERMFGVMERVDPVVVPPREEIIYDWDTNTFQRNYTPVGIVNNSIAIEQTDSDFNGFETL